MARRRRKAKAIVGDPHPTHATPYGRFPVELWEMIVEASLPPYPFDEKGKAMAGEALVAVALCQVNSSFLAIAKKYVYRRCTPRMLLNGQTVFENDLPDWWTRIDRNLRSEEFARKMLEEWNDVFVKWESRAAVFGPYVHMAYWDWDCLSPDSSRFALYDVVAQYQDWEFTQRFVQNSKGFATRDQCDADINKFTAAINQRVSLAERRLVDSFNRFVNLKWLSVVHPFCGLAELSLPHLKDLSIIGKPYQSNPLEVARWARPLLKFLSQHPLIRRCRLNHETLEAVISVHNAPLQMLPILSALELLIVEGYSYLHQTHGCCIGNATCGIAGLEWISPNAPLRKGPGILERRARPDYHLFSVGGIGTTVEQWCEWDAIGDRELYMLAEYGAGPTLNGLKRPLHPWDYAPRSCFYER